MLLETERLVIRSVELIDEKAFEVMHRFYSVKRL